MEAKHYEPLPKPEKVEIGQQWWHHKFMKCERAFTVIDVKEDMPHLIWPKGPYAIFRKRKFQNCNSLLNEPNWYYVGNINVNTNENIQSE